VVRFPLTHTLYVALSLSLPRVPDGGASDLWFGASSSWLHAAEAYTSISSGYSSLMAMGSRLAGTGTSSVVPVPSGGSSSFEGEGSEAPRPPGDCASLDSGEEFGWRGADEESRRGRLFQGANAGTNAVTQVNVDGGAEFRDTG